jgi:hypothetical protein
MHNPLILLKTIGTTNKTTHKTKFWIVCVREIQNEGKIMQTQQDTPQTVIRTKPSSWQNGRIHTKHSPSLARFQILKAHSPFPQTGKVDFIGYSKNHVKSKLNKRLFLKSKIS